MVEQPLLKGNGSFPNANRLITTSLSLTTMSSCITIRPPLFKAYTLPLKQVRQCKKPSSPVMLLSCLAYVISFHLNLFLLRSSRQKTMVGVLVLVNMRTEVGSLGGDDKQHCLIDS
ncbi:hypothetical protein Hanom_Chr04g00307461 [Helianthus anomalus]